MHETSILKNILRYFESQEALASDRVRKAYFSISEFGSLSREHFLEHFQQAVSGTRFEGVEAVVKTIPFGPELEITGLEFTKEEGKDKK